jgi:hypothetical protein
MKTVRVKPSPEARRRARGLVIDLREMEVGTGNLFGHLDIARLIGPVDPAGNDDAALHRSATGVPNESAVFQGVIWYGGI